jgi:hypothetical protein
MPNPLPVLVFDLADPKIGQVARNIYHAQKAGWPTVLTYCLPADLLERRLQREWLRHEALGEVPRILSRDEYPFACTYEHQGSVWVGHVLLEQNLRQGGMVRAFLARYHAQDGFRFRIATEMPPSPR